MTDQPPPGNFPPPPPGGYPPPPPSAGDYSIPPQGGYAPTPQGGFAPPAGSGGALPQDAYTPWLTRVLAWILDYIPVYLLVGIGFAILGSTRETACITDTSGLGIGDICATGASTLGQVSALGVFPLLAFAFVVWNLGYRQGTTGSSIGKSILKFKLISEKTGAPIGFGMSIVRELIYLVFNGACGLLWLIAVLFPLWDAKRQTLVDKILTTVCVPL